MHISELQTSPPRSLSVSVQLSFRRPPSVLEPRSLVAAKEQRGINNAWSRLSVAPNLFIKLVCLYRKFLQRAAIRIISTQDISDLLRKKHTGVHCLMTLKSVHCITGGISKSANADNSARPTRTQKCQCCTVPHWRSDCSILWMRTLPLISDVTSDRPRISRWNQWGRNQSLLEIYQGTIKSLSELSKPTKCLSHGTSGAKYNEKECMVQHWNTRDVFFECSVIR